MKSLITPLALLGLATGSLAHAAPDGGTLFARNCASCHASGPGHPGTARLIIDSGPDVAVLEQRSDLNAERVTTAVRQGFQMMPPFRRTELSDAEVKAIARWLSAPKSKR
ncbi:MAG: cytochrome c [Novosphingobium sp.]|jgi:(+)-pinoresinol hydroxylase|uniref:c-type cytochrome n=1 Tax=Novosphingobium sp. TaxID=1874826 RepID=UPI003017143C